MGTARFGKVLTAMVTPFHDDGGLDLDGAAALARWLVDQGNDGLVDRRHHRRGADAVRRRGGRAVAGRARRRRRAAARRHGQQRHAPHRSSSRSGPPRPGVDGLLVVSPYYNRPTQAGLEAHFRAVAAATALPIVMYDVPARTGPHLEVDTIVRLANEVPTIAGLKDARGRPRRGCRHRGRRPRRVRRLLGRRRAHPAPAGGRRRRCHRGGHPLDRRSARRDDRRPRQGRRRRARARSTPASCPASRSRSGPPGSTSSAAKAAMEALGRPAGPLRLPLAPLDDAVRSAVGEVLGRTGARPWLIPSRSRSSGAWARSGATAPASRSAGASCCSTCGLMFPDIDMLGVDLVLPDFTYLRDNADRVDGAIITHGHEDHMGGLSYLLRELSFPIYGSALTLGLARNRIEEAGLLDRTELIPVRDGERRRIGPCQVEFIPVTHSVPHGLRHGLPHAAGHDPALGRLQARPHAGRRPAHRPGPHRRARVGRRHPPAAQRLDQRRRARSRPQRALGGQGALRPVPRARGPAHRHRLLRQPRAPGAADRRRRRGVRAQGGDARPVDEEERAAGPRHGPAAHPRPRAGRHRRRPRPAARRRCA